MYIEIRVQWLNSIPFRANSTSLLVTSINSRSVCTCGISPLLLSFMPSFPYIVLFHNYVVIFVLNTCCHTCTSLSASSLRLSIFCKMSNVIHFGLALASLFGKVVCANVINMPTNLS